MAQADMIHIGCLIDGRTVYVAPAGRIDLNWLRQRHPHVLIKRNTERDRDEIEYTVPAYKDFLAYLREDGWRVIGAGASDQEETLRFVRK